MDSREVHEVCQIIGGAAWVASPEEDFAEVYKNVVSGLDIRTIYGTVVPVGNWPDSNCLYGGT